MSRQEEQEPVYVNGLRLPELLVDMIARGQWKRPPDVRRLRAMTGIKHSEDLAFFDIEGMVRETAGMARLVEKGYGAIFGLSLEEDDQGGGRLAVRRAVLIAADYEDNAICLDYRESLNEPAVVVSTYPGRRHCSWRRIATNFTGFVRDSGLAGEKR